MNTWVESEKKHYFYLFIVYYKIHLINYIYLTSWRYSNPLRMHWAFYDNIRCCTTHCHYVNDIKVSRYENFPSEMIHFITTHCSICIAIYCYFILGDHCVDRCSPFYLEVIVSKVTLTWYYRTRCWWNFNRLTNTLPCVKISIMAYIKTTEIAKQKLQFRNWQDQYTCIPFHWTSLLVHVHLLIINHS